MKRILKLAVIAVISAMAGTVASAQDSEPVRFNVTKERVSDDIVQVKFEAVIADGWHVYSTGLEEGGPVSAAVVLESAKNVKPEGTLKADGKEIGTYDNMFGMDVRYFENKVVFIQNFKVKGNRFSAKGCLEYGACNDTMCLPPSSIGFTFDESVLK